MTYDLYLGDRTYSSWSLRGWLMLEKFALPYRTTMVGLYSGTMARDLAPLAPARTVPAMKTPEGHVLTDSLSMAETLAERHPEAGLWPRDPAARALARNLVAEMHAGFGALRADCPNNLSCQWIGFAPSGPVHADVARIEALWSLAQERFGAGGQWLFGDYSLADVFYAPVACRLVTYDLPVGEAARAYINAHLGDPAFNRWQAEAATEVHEPPHYVLPLENRPFPNRI